MPTLKNKTKQSLIASRVKIADSFFSRMIGLLKHSYLSREEGLLITQCQSIHMFFMRFPIDVVFVDRRHRVVGLVENIKPFCLSPIFWKASYAVELAAGTIANLSISVGDELEMI